jgi:deoxyribose-phosphate aldolase
MSHACYNTSVNLSEVILLDPAATRRETIALCEWALTRPSVTTLTVLPAWVADAVDALAGTGKSVGTVIGYPFGLAPAQAKAVEAAMATADGATQVTLYLNLSALKSGAELLVADEIASVVDAASPAGASVVVAIPWEALKPRERQSAVRIAIESGADAILLPVAEKESADALREFLPEELRMHVQCNTEAEAEQMRACGAAQIVLIKEAMG